MLKRIYQDLGKGWFIGAIIFGLFCSSIPFYAVPLSSLDSNVLLKAVWVVFIILSGTAGFFLIITEKLHYK